MSEPNPTYFETPADFRAWLAANHATADELWVGFYKKGSGRLSITWPESVDQALCYGWIDGLRKRLDDERYVIRFTPRRRGSIWSEVNRRRVAELSAQGLMQPAGQDPRRPPPRSPADRAGRPATGTADGHPVPSSVRL